MCIRDSFKTAVSLEQTGKVQIVALDKTGTITRGEPSVTDLVPAEGVSERELLQLAYALEQKSEHPLAKAILQRAQQEQVEAQEVEDFSALPGNGLSARLGGARLVGGSLKFISSQVHVCLLYTSCWSRWPHRRHRPCRYWCHRPDWPDGCYRRSRCYRRDGSDRSDWPHWPDRSHGSHRCRPGDADRICRWHTI